MCFNCRKGLGSPERSGHCQGQSPRRKLNARPEPMRILQVTLSSMRKGCWSKGKTFSSLWSSLFWRPGSLKSRHAQDAAYGRTVPLFQPHLAATLRQGCFPARARAIGCQCAQWLREWTLKQMAWIQILTVSFASGANLLSLSVLHFFYV